MEFFVILILLMIYFIPGIIAGKRNHRNKNAIFTLNALAGWTIVGWIISMVWAMTADTAPKK